MQVSFVTLLVACQPCDGPHREGIVDGDDGQLVLATALHEYLWLLHAVLHLTFKRLLQVVGKLLQAGIVAWRRDADEHFTQIDVLVLVGLVVVAYVGDDLVAVQIDISTALLQYLVGKLLYFLSVVPQFLLELGQNIQSENFRRR